MSLSATPEPHKRGALPSGALRLAFSHLNLRFNPFGEPPPQDRADLAAVETSDLPAGLPVSFASEHNRVAWFVEAQVKVQGWPAWSITVPVTVGTATVRR